MFDPISDFWDPHPDPHCIVVSEPAHQSYNNLINPSICRQLVRLISTCHRLPVFTTGGSRLPDIQKCELITKRQLMNRTCTNL